MIVWDHQVHADVRQLITPHRQCASHFTQNTTVTHPSIILFLGAHKASALTNRHLSVVGTIASTHFQQKQYE
jgi:hypothetical protein